MCGKCPHEIRYLQPEEIAFDMMVLDAYTAKQQAKVDEAIRNGAMPVVAMKGG